MANPLDKQQQAVLKSLEKYLQAHGNVNELFKKPSERDINAVFANKLFTTVKITNPDSSENAKLFALASVAVVFACSPIKRKEGPDTLSPQVATAFDYVTQIMQDKVQANKIKAAIFQSIVVAGKGVDLQTVEGQKKYYAQCATAIINSPTLDLDKKERIISVFADQVEYFLPDATNAVQKSSAEMIRKQCAVGVEAPKATADVPNAVSDAPKIDSTQTTQDFKARRKAMVLDPSQDFTSSGPKL